MALAKLLSIIGCNFIGLFSSLFNISRLQLARLKNKSDDTASTTHTHTNSKIHNTHNISQPWHQEDSAVAPTKGFSVLPTRPSHLPRMHPLCEV